MTRALASMTCIVCFDLFTVNPGFPDITPADLDSNTAARGQDVTGNARPPSGLTRKPTVYENESAADPLLDNMPSRTR